MAFNEANARARVLAVIKTISNYGKAYDYERFVKEWATLRSLFTSSIGGTTRLRGWTVSLDSVRQSAETLGAHGDKAFEATYIYRIRGFEAVDDANASEKTFHALALSVIAALDADAYLHSANYEGGASNYFVSAPCQAELDYRMFAGVLCHFIEITKEVTEYV